MESPSPDWVGAWLSYFAPLGREGVVNVKVDVNEKFEDGTGRLGLLRRRLGPLKPTPAHSQIRVPRGWLSDCAGEFEGRGEASVPWGGGRWKGW